MKLNRNSRFLFLSIFAFFISVTLEGCEKNHPHEPDTPPSGPPPTYSNITPSSDGTLMIYSSLNKNGFFVTLLIEPVLKPNVPFSIVFNVPKKTCDVFSSLDKLFDPSKTNGEAESVEFMNGILNAFERSPEPIDPNNSNSAVINQYQRDSVNNSKKQIIALRLDNDSKCLTDFKKKRSYDRIINIKNSNNFQIQQYEGSYEGLAFFSNSGAMKDVLSKASPNLKYLIIENSPTLLT